MFEISVLSLKDSVNIGVVIGAIEERIPELEFVASSRRSEVEYWVLARFSSIVKRVKIHGFDGRVVEVRPSRHSLAMSFQFGVLLVVVGEEGSVLAGVYDIEEVNEELFVEFELSRELDEQLMDAVEELEEDWRLLLCVLRAGRVVATIQEFVTISDPLLFNQHLEANVSAVIRIEHQHRQRSELRRSVPTVRAMDYDGCLLHVHQGGCENSSIQDSLNMLQPTTVVQTIDPSVAIHASYTSSKDALWSKWAWKRSSYGTLQSNQAIAHRVDVLNAKKFDSQPSVML